MHFDFTLPGERWAPVDGWDDYFISDHGRMVSTKHKGAGKLMKLHHARYTSVAFGKVANFLVHRLVAKAFLPAPLSGQYQVAHFDGDTSNNHFTNLRWATPRENNSDKIRHGTHQNGVKHPIAKLREVDVVEIRRRCAAGQETLAKIASDYGVQFGVIWKIRERRLWKHLP